MSVSIVTACYNSASTIGTTIQSVNSQSYSNIEHLFIDGCSGDDTLHVISSQSQVNHLVLSEPDAGIYDALNKGIKRASGEVIGFLHADDFYAGVNVVERIAECFIKPEVQAVYGDLQYVGQEDTSRVIRNWRTKEFDHGKLRRGWMPPHPSLYVRREWYEKIMGFDTEYRISADYLSVLQFFSSPGFTSVYLPRVLVKMRVGGVSNRSLKSLIQKSREDYSALRKTGVGGFGTLLAKNARKVGQFL